MKRKNGEEHEAKSYPVLAREGEDKEDEARRRGPDFEGSRGRSLRRR